jgi:hypothetical protein
VAALETALALADLALERTGVTVIAPDTEFVYRPMVVREPFAYGVAHRSIHSSRSSTTPARRCSVASSALAQLLEDSNSSRRFAHMALQQI